MPPENHKELNADKVYISREGEAPIPLDGIQEVELEPAEGGVVDPAIVIGAERWDCVVPCNTSASRTFTAKLTVPRSVYNDWRRWHKWMELCRRYIHLAWHGKNWRIRKKNLKLLWDTYYNGEKAIKL